MALKYSVFILDNNFTLQAVLDTESWSYTRGINQASQMSVTIPRDSFSDSPKSQFAKIASYLQIYQNGEYCIGGKITKRTVKENTIQMDALTEEIRLEQAVTPSMYGRKYEDWDIADVVKDLVYGWSTQRIKAKAQWDLAVDSSNIDTATESGIVLLSKSGTSYNSSGYITLRFDSDTIEDFVKWDRIRWVSDNINPVFTTVQYRYGATLPLGDFSIEFEGGAPDTLGIDTGATTQRYLEVKVNLKTDDTTSQDGEGNAVGSTPRLFALESIARTSKFLDTTYISASYGKLVKGIEADSVTSFNLLKSVCEQHNFEFEVFAGELYVNQTIGVDRTKEFVLRSGKNMTINSLGDDDLELVNILTARGSGDGLNRLEVTLRDETSIETYGSYPRTVDFETTDYTELQTLADDYLTEHKDPVTAWRINTHTHCDDLQSSSKVIMDKLAFHRLHSNRMFSTTRSSTYLSSLPYLIEPDYTAGDLITLIDSGTLIEARIEQEVRRGSPNGLEVQLYLNKTRLSLIDSIIKPIESGKLNPPQSITSIGIVKGASIKVVQPPERFRWSETELYMSSEADFTPTAENLIDSGRKTTFDISDLTPKQRYFFKARYIDTSGIASFYSAETSAVAGSVIQGIGDYASELRPVLIVASLPSLPDGTYPENSYVFSIADELLYKNEADEWVAQSIDDPELSVGQIASLRVVAGTIQAGAVKAQSIDTIDLFSERLKIRETGAIYSDFYNPDGTINTESVATKGFYIGADGELKAVNGEFTGKITATEGTFSGTLIASDGSLGAISTEFLFNGTEVIISTDTFQDVIDFIEGYTGVDTAGSFGGSFNGKTYYAFSKKREIVPRTPSYSPTYYFYATDNTTLTKLGSDALGFDFTINTVSSNTFINSDTEILGILEPIDIRFLASSGMVFKTTAGTASTLRARTITIPAGTGMSSGYNYMKTACLGTVTCDMTITNNSGNNVAVTAYVNINDDGIYASRTFSFGTISNGATVTVTHNLTIYPNDTFYVYRNLSGTASALDVTLTMKCNESNLSTSAMVLGFANV